MLDFRQLTAQLDTFTLDNQRSLRESESGLHEARRRLQIAGEVYEALTQKLDGKIKTSWLIPRPCEQLSSTHTASEIHLVHNVFSSDGSQIIGDRHEIAECLLINIGLISLFYGTKKPPQLESIPRLMQSGNEILTDMGESVEYNARQIASERLLAELVLLADMCEQEQSEAPSVALVDGTLILWSIENESDEYKASCLERFNATLDRFRDMGIPVAGYISRPGGKEVVNLLRVAVCPHPSVNCDTYCPNRHRPKSDAERANCHGVEGVSDELLYSDLPVRHRSSLFYSTSSILESSLLTTKFTIFTFKQEAKSLVWKYPSGWVEIAAFWN